MKRPLLQLLLLLAACGDDVPLGSLAPVAVLDPPPGTLLAFEDVVLGKDKGGKLFVTTKNKGEVDLTVAAHVENEGAIRLSSVNKRVIAGGYGEVFVRFEPKIHGDTETVLVIETNDPKLPEARYPVIGRARERCSLYAWPTYQRVRVHEVAEVVIYNDSYSPCELTSLWIERSDQFALLDPPPIPYQLPPLGSLTLHVEHTLRTDVAGAPVRQLHVKERDGTELLVSLEGELGIWNCLSVFPPLLTFPTGDAGVWNRSSVQVYSSCDETTTVLGGAIGLGYYFFNVDDSQFPIDIPPFGEVEVFVDYLPFFPEGDEGRMTISTNDALNRRMKVDLFGKAFVPELITLPAMDFGAVVPSCSERVERIPLLAIGQGRSVITSLTIEGDSAFSIDGVLLDGTLLVDDSPPIAISSGSSAQVLVRFAPVLGTPAEHRAELVLTHNGLPVDRTRRTSLIGRAVAAGPRTELFVAPASAPVDLLWVIDDSRSMEPEQDRLQVGMSAFASAIETPGASYQIAMVAGEEESRSPGWPYNCPPHPYVVGSSYSDPAARLDALTCAARIGYSSEARRAGFGAAMYGLLRGVDPASNPNPLPTFLRKEADLTLIFVSDEDDQSKVSDTAFRDFIYSVKGSYRPDRIRVHAIAGDPAVPCMIDPWLTPGDRYARIARETGGTFQSVCTTDFSPLMSSLGSTIVAPTNRFDLEQPADPASLEVSVNGAPVAVDPIDGYSFDALANAVHLNGVSQPIAGSTVAVSYADACR